MGLHLADESEKFVVKFNINNVSAQGENGHNSDIENNEDDMIIKRVQTSHMTRNPSISSLIKTLYVASNPSIFIVKLGEES